MDKKRTRGKYTYGKICVYKNVGAELMLKYKSCKEKKIIIPEVGTLEKLVA